MPKSPNDTPAMFRAPSELVARAKAHAKREGVSLSALLRAGVENILTRAESLRPNGALGTFLSGKFESAAKGDTESLRWLFDNRVTALQSADPQSVSAVMLASEAMVFGRLLASRGDETDMRRLAGAMVQASTFFRDMPRLREGLLAEAVSILEQLAEDGDELASLASQTLIGREPESVVEKARAYRSNAKKTVPEDV